MGFSDTIAAIATPAGEGAIALLRLSGAEAFPIIDRVFQASRGVRARQPRKQHFGIIFDGERKVDEVLVTQFPAPASYTGEDVAEVTCHGGMLVTRRILDLLLRRGARAALPGEFTQRAFLNGKLDLTQAEAVMDLISAQSDLALDAAQEQLGGALGRRIADLENGLLETLAQVEAYIDFPEEDITPETGRALRAKVEQILKGIGEMLATFDRGVMLREGIRTVIFGAPNVGKSSLLNLLLGYDRAIVSATPGTTRDSIEEVINLRGLPLRLVDTAGIRVTSDAIEEAGIERTRRELHRAGLVLEVHDVTQPKPTRGEISDIALPVLNKADRTEHPTWSGVDAVRISCVTGDGMGALEEAIEARLSRGQGATTDWSVAINTRHRALLEQAQEALRAARSGLEEDLSAELLAEELRAGLTALGEIVGRSGAEDLLGKIFSQFCIGK